MKREIKFRGLNANKEWVYGLISKDTEGSTQYYTEMPYRVCWFEDSAHCNQPIITESVGQFTGLKDKNGKEVYEGDIIEFDNTEIGGTKTTGEVVFNTDITLSKLEWGLWTRKGYYRTDFLGRIEIIGSIHQNPELL